jgi:hypothetical protein
MANKLDIPVFFGTLSNISLIKLDFINAEITPLKSRYLKRKIKFWQQDDQELYYYNHMIERGGNALIEEKIATRYAIIPIDLDKPFLEEDWQHFHQMLLSIFPSDFSLVEIIHLYRNEEGYSNFSKTEFTFMDSGSKYYENFLFIGKEEYKFVNQYLKNYFHSSKKLKYLKYILGVFANSFQEYNRIYQYLSLIICLEVIVDGKEQLTYRLKRNVALLCGEKIYSCKIIFDNIAKLYKLRSAIVHGSINPDFNNFDQYLEYLQILVARLIRELVVHNIKTIEELNEKITTLGYGQNRLISNNYKKFKSPLVSNIRLRYKTL